MEKEKKSPGRPRILTDEERNNRRSSYHKSTGYASQIKYQKNNPIVKLLIKEKYQKTLDDLLAETGMDAAELFFSAVEEKYGRTLHDVDKKENS